MSDNATNQELIERLKNQPKPKFKLSQKYLYIFVVTVVLIGGYIIYKSARSYLGYELVSQERIHWHAELEIIDKGARVSIPPSIGLINAGDHPSNMHTHEEDGIIHMEIPGPVRVRDIRLGRFFDVWERDKDLPTHMFVNRVENYEYYDYIMQDGDKIRLIYE